jgi:hypothetical protein
VGIRNTYRRRDKKTYQRIRATEGSENQLVNKAIRKVWMRRALASLTSEEAVTRECSYPTEGR